MGISWRREGRIQSRGGLGEMGSWGGSGRIQGKSKVNPVESVSGAEIRVEGWPLRYPAPVLKDKVDSFALGLGCHERHRVIGSWALAWTITRGLVGPDSPKALRGP